MSNPLKITEIQATIHQIALELRNLDELISSPKFGEAYELADEKSKREIITMINNRDLDGLRKWQIRRLSEGSLADKTVVQLRAMGRNYGINTTGMDKAQLLHYIEEARRAARDKRLASVDANSNSEIGN